METSDAASRLRPQPPPSAKRKKGMSRELPSLRVQCTMVDLLRPIANPRLRMRRWISRIPRLIAATSSSGTGEDDNAGEGAMMGCTTAAEERDATGGAMTGLMAKGDEDEDEGVVVGCAEERGNLSVTRAKLEDIAALSRLLQTVQVLRSDHRPS